MNWLNEERQQVPSLLRQCRIAIRQHLSVAAQYRTILPAIDKLPLPNNMKLYLQFDGTVTEVDLSVCKNLQTLETTDETLAESRCQLLSPYNSEHSDYDLSDVEDYYMYLYGRDTYDSDYYCYMHGSDSDDSSHWW